MSTYPNIATPTITPTPTVTPSQTPTRTATSIPTVTSTPTITFYTGNDRQGAYGVKADISAPPAPPYLENGGSSGQSNWVSIPNVSNRWMQAGWRHYWWYEYDGALPYVEWKIVNPPPGDSGYNIEEYETDLQNWGTFKTYEITWDYGTRWCGRYANNALICDDVGISAPRSVFAHSEVHASPLNELDTIFMNVHYMDSARNWNLFDEERWVTESPYNVDKWFLFEFRNYGP